MIDTLNTYQNSSGDLVTQIAVYGTPMAKPRMTQRDKWKKRPCVVRYRDWCDRVRALGDMPSADEVVYLSWVAYFEPPKSWSKKKKAAAIGQLHRQRPDRDNIDKAVLDCLYKEDSAIAAGTIRKIWDTTARIEIFINHKPKETE